MIKTSINDVSAIFCEIKKNNSKSMLAYERDERSLNNKAKQQTKKSRRN